MWAIYDQEDDKLWEEEVVEVFIDPDGDGRNYLELEVNPLNTVVDLIIVQLAPTWESDFDWDIAGLQTAVQTYGTVNDSLGQDEGWTVEIAIPWAAMAARINAGRPSPGDTWRLNVCRIERKGGRELMSQIRSLQAQIEQILEDAGVDSPEQLSPELQEKRAQLQEQLDPLADHYFNRQTEYTAWSETYQGGFHHPTRFGVVQFAE